MSDSARLALPECRSASCRPSSSAAAQKALGPFNRQTSLAALGQIAWSSARRPGRVTADSRYRSRQGDRDQSSAGAGSPAVPKRPGRKTDRPTARRRGLTSHVELRARTLLLDTCNRVIGKPMVYRGSLNAVDMRISEIFRDAVRSNAAAIIVAHHHPVRLQPRIFQPPAR